MSDVKTVYEDKDFKLRVENYDEVLFVHCDFNNYTKSSLRKGKTVFQEVKEAAYYNGWDQIFTYTQNPKFCKVFGAEQVETIYTPYESYEVMVWDLR